MSDDDSKKAAERLTNLTAAQEKAKAEIEARQAAYAGQYGQYGQYSNAMQAFGVGNGASLQAQLGAAAQAQSQASTTYGPYYYQAAGYVATAVAVVHHFTGAPKNEVKNVGCGEELVTESGKGFLLVGLAAATNVNDVTCLGCLRALIKSK